MEVLDDEEHRAVEDLIEEVDDDVVGSGAPELGSIGVGLRRRCDVGAERVRRAAAASAGVPALPAE